MGNPADRMAAADTSDKWNLYLMPDEEKRVLRFCRRRGITMAQLIAGAIMFDVGVRAASNITAACST